MRIVVSLLAAAALALSGCLGGLVGSDPPGPRDYVSGKYSTWVVEVDTIQGMAPPASAMNLLKSRLEGVANKPGGIELRTDDSLPARGGTWTVKDVEAYSNAHLDAETGGETVVLHLMFLDGSYSTENVLGVTLSRGRDGKVVSTGPIAIFSESIREACAPVLLVSPCTDVSSYWAAVLVHEFGHAMGLVNNGIAMQRDHEADTCNTGGGARPDSRHSSNSASVMFCAVETFDITNAFGGGGPPTSFDADDRADLCAAGGKC